MGHLFCYGPLMHPVTIEGAGHELTIIDGMVTGCASGVVLSGLTIRGGSAGGVVVGASKSVKIKD